MLLRITIAEIKTTLMKVQIQSIHFTAKQDLLDFVQQKVAKLQQYFDRIIAGEVALKTDADSSGANKVCEIRLLIKGNDLLAKATSSSFEEATTIAVDALKRQIEKHKGKLQSHSV
jgi:putative sigma-54 modulation protein